MEADLAAMDGRVRAGERRGESQVQANIAATKAQLQQTQDQAQVEATQREADAKIAALKEQGHRAHQEHKVQIDKRAAQVNADYEERKAKLDQARQLRKEARRATHEASHTRNDPTAPVTTGAAESCPRKSHIIPPAAAVLRSPSVHLPRPQALRPRRWEDSDVR
jgi:hypothetical protein